VYGNTIQDGECSEQELHASDGTEDPTEESLNKIGGRNVNVWNKHTADICESRHIVEGFYFSIIFILWYHMQLFTTASKS
jgi:hypothetical protein